MSNFNAIRAVVVLASIAIGTWSAHGEEGAPTLEERWVYCPTNLLVDANVDRLEGIFRRAAKAGYTHINLTDSKFCRLEEMPASYFQNVERVKQLAADLDLELVPGVFPIGWSNDLLSRDPNLAEGLPVQGALLVVTKGEARLVADPPVTLKGGDFSDLALWDWKDDCVTAADGAARIRDPHGANARIVQQVKVAPFRQYHIAVRIKTQEFRGVPEIKVLADGKALAFNDLGIQSTQDWTLYHTVFNSLDHDKVTIYLGSWGAETGELWFDDAVLEEVGLLNLLRRPGAPLVVRREGAGSKAPPLAEGKDFEPVADPRMGNNQWPGDYDVWHEPPTVKTSLPDGTRLRVSYYHPMIIYGGSVMIALSEPKTLEVLRDHARRVHEAFQAKAYFMNHDEIRVLNWDAASEKRGLDAGPLLAENVRACAAILRDLNPGGRIYVWSDMFDPYHNAHADYYLVRGDLARSWEGLDPDVIIVNWNHGERDKSLKWFADRGHRTLIAGYYDAPVGQARDWLESARGVPGVIGMMYTTWQGNYDDLERFAEELDRDDSSRRP